MIDVSSDAPNDAGNLTGIVGALTINTGASVNNPINNINQVIISNNGGAAGSVTLSSTQISGFTATPITYSQTPTGAQALILVGSNAGATTFNVATTLGPGQGNTVELVGGSASGNIYNIQGAASSVTVNTTFFGATNNTINISSNAPTNTGNLAGILSAITVEASAGTSTLNVSNVGGTTAATATLTNAQISGLTTNPITYTEAAGGKLAINILGANAMPDTFVVASTLGAGNTVTLTGGSGGSNVFNLQGATADTVTMISGNGPTNTFNISSDAPTNMGTTSGITSAVVVTSGTGSNILNVSDAGGTATDTIALTNAQITGYTTNPIAYTEGAGGKLAVNLFGPNVAGSSLTITSTLGAGNTLSLNGGSGGGTVFNVQAATADTVTVNTGSGSGNTVNLASDAPANMGTPAGITSAVTVNGGTGSSTLVVSNEGGAAASTVTLTNAAITGLTTKPIAYTEASGGTLAIDIIGADAMPTNFIVTSTLGSGNTVLLTGGSGGGNVFDIGSTFAANNGQLNNIGAAVTVNGGTGTGNSLEIDDHGTTGAFSYLVNSKSVTNDPATPRTFGGVFFSNVQTMQLDATDQQNQFTVGPSATTVFTINAYKPTALPLVPAGTGDALTIDFTGTQGAHLTKMAVPAGGNSYNGTWTFTNEQTVNFTSIEQLPIPIVVYGTDASITGKPMVKVLLAGSTQVLSTFMPYEATFHGGVRVAVGYFDGTGQQEIAVAPGPGRAPLVKVYDPMGNLLFSFMAYASNNLNGVNIAVGNVENKHAGINPIDDIITAPSRGVSDIRVFHNQFLTVPATPMTLFREFTAWSKTFIGGSTVASADLNGDGRDDVIVGSGSGMQSLIEAFNVTVAASSYAPFKIFYPFVPSYQGGVNVSAIDVGQGVTVPEVIASQANSGTSQVRVYNGSTGVSTSLFTAYTGNGSNAPVRAAPIVIGGHLFIFTAQGTDGRSHTVREYDPTTGTLVDYILENDPNFDGFYLG